MVLGENHERVGVARHLLAAGAGAGMTTAYAHPRPKAARGRPKPKSQSSGNRNLISANAYLGAASEFGFSRLAATAAAEEFAA